MTLANPSIILLIHIIQLSHTLSPLLLLLSLQQSSHHPHQTSSPRWSNHRTLTICGSQLPTIATYVITHRPTSLRPITTMSHHHQRITWRRRRTQDPTLRNWWRRWWIRSCCENGKRREQMVWLTADFVEYCSRVAYACM